MDHVATEFAICLAGIRTFLVQVFLPYVQFLPFGVGMSSLCHIMLNI